jgi:signal peptidase I
MKRLLAVLKSLDAKANGHALVSAGQRRIFKLLLLVALSFGSYLFFSRMVVTAVEVKGASMAPTLRAGDRCLLNRFAYLTREPARGELVVLKDPETGDLIVKRIVGMPFETVIMRNDAAYVNGRRIFEPYASRYVREDYSPLSKATVCPKDHYFVLGDNRNRSVDSRAFGPVPRESILGVISL